jgi:hypothetical protein
MMVPYMCVHPVFHTEVSNLNEGRLLLCNNKTGCPIVERQCCTAVALYNFSARMT